MAGRNVRLQESGRVEKLLSNECKATKNPARSFCQSSPFVAQGRGVHLAGRCCGGGGRLLQGGQAPLQGCPLLQQALDARLRPAQLLLRLRQTPNFRFKID